MIYLKKKSTVDIWTQQALVNFCSSYKIFKKKAIIRLAPLWLLSDYSVKRKIKVLLEGNPWGKKIQSFGTNI